MYFVYDFCNKLINKQQAEGSGNIVYNITNKDWLIDWLIEEHSVIQLVLKKNLGFLRKSFMFLVF